jgi:hypothetical protein
VVGGSPPVRQRYFDVVKAAKANHSLVVETISHPGRAVRGQFSQIIVPAVLDPFVNVAGHVAHALLGVAIRAVVGAHGAGVTVTVASIAHDTIHQLRIGSF